MGSPMILSEQFVRELLDRTGDPGAESLSRLIVAEWVDSFFHSVRNAGTTHPPLAYDVVTAWFRLWRTKPGLIEETTGQDVPEHRQIESGFWSGWPPSASTLEHEKTLRKRLPELVEIAQRVPQPLAWINRLTAYVETCVDEGKTVQTEAVELLEELDNASLFHAAATFAFGEPPSQLERELQVARRALSKEAYAFINVGDFVRAWIKTVDFQNPAAPSLAASAEWCVPLLEELARYQQFVRGEEPVPDELTETASSLLHAWRTDQRAMLISFIQRLAKEDEALPSVALAAAPATSGEVVGHTELRWVSPDRRSVAVVDLPPVVAEDERLERLPLRFHRVAVPGRLEIGAEEKSLAGTRVRLCGSETTIDQEARASFPLHELHQGLKKGAPLHLELIRPQGRELWSLTGNLSWPGTQPS